MGITLWKVADVRVNATSATFARPALRPECDQRAIAPELGTTRADLGTPTPSLSTAAGVPCGSPRVIHGNRADAHSSSTPERGRMPPASPGRMLVIHSIHTAYDDDYLFSSWCFGPEHLRVDNVGWGAMFPERLGATNVSSPSRASSVAVSASVSVRRGIPVSPGGPPGQEVVCREVSRRT